MMRNISTNALVMVSKAATRSFLIIFSDFCVQLPVQSQTMQVTGIEQGCITAGSLPA